MQDYIKRLLIAGIMAICISLLFLGGKHSQAEMLNIEALTEHWTWPADGVITDTYGTRHGSHNGIDIAGGLGTMIYSVDEGVVYKSYYSDSYGHVVFIKHKNNLETVYAHLNKRSVKEGQTVKQGDIIGQMGSTGDSSGVHLHFEVHEMEWTVDKKNAIDPVIALGQVELGETVQALKEEDKKNKAMETIAEMPTYDGLSVNSNHVVEEQKNREQVLKQELTNNHEIRKDATHIVQPGESLWAIAEKYETTVKAIEDLNNLKNKTIYPNQELVVAKSVKASQYIVQPGDTLTLIAEKTKNTVQQLLEQNNLSSDVIYPQQVIVFQQIQ